MSMRGREDFQLIPRFPNGTNKNVITHLPQNNFFLLIIRKKWWCYLQKLLLGVLTQNTYKKCLGHSLIHVYPTNDRCHSRALSVQTVEVSAIWKIKPSPELPPGYETRVIKVTNYIGSLTMLVKNIQIRKVTRDGICPLALKHRINFHGEMANWPLWFRWLGA